VPRATVPRNLRVRVQQLAAQALDAIPPALQIRLSGKPPVQVDGDTLAPEIQLTLALLERRKEPPLETLAPAEAREARRRLTAVFGGRPTAVRATTDLVIDGPAPIPARHYEPLEPGGPHPLLVYYHGGGFLYGDLDTHDNVCRILCRHAGAHVLAVDYRLSPEHPFPAAVEDARAALRWAHVNAERLGADPSRIGVGGDSAGGNLAAVTSQLAANDGGPAPVLQLLIYPVTDFTIRRRSRELFGDGFLLTNDEMDWFEDGRPPASVFPRRLPDSIVAATPPPAPRGPRHAASGRFQSEQASLPGCCEPTTDAGPGCYPDHVRVRRRRRARGGAAGARRASAAVDGPPPRTDVRVRRPRWLHGAHRSARRRGGGASRT
jgi:acetyl esterase/lipase